MEKVSFKKYLNLQALAVIFNQLPPLKTPIVDLLYPESVRSNHPFDQLGWSDLGLNSKNIPLITRGTASYPVKPESKQLTFIEPANFTPSIFVSATDLNRLKNVSNETVQVYLTNKLDQLRRIVRSSTEALAVQSLSGKIDYDIRVDNGSMDKYQVSFGSVKTVAISKKWDATGITIGSVSRDLSAMRSKLQETSSGSDIVFLCGADVIASLLDIAATAKNESLIKQSGNDIIVGTNRITEVSSVYYDYAKKANVPAIAPKTIQAVARDDSFSLKYCAVDSLDAGLLPTPFYAREVYSYDPEGITLIGHSRPMPIPNVNAMISATVLS